LFRIVPDYIDSIDSFKESFAFKEPDFMYGIKNFDYKYDNPVNKILHIQNRAFGVVPQHSNGFMPAEKDVYFSEHALNNRKPKVDAIPDQSILSYVLIYCERHDFSLNGLTFHDKQDKCLLKIALTPGKQTNSSNNSSYFS